MDKIKENVGGFNIPLQIRQRKGKIDEVLRKHTDLNEGHALLFLSGLNEAETKKVAADLDTGKIDEVAVQMRERALRELIRTKMKEVVRKKAGGGGYVLYSPNQGKKKTPKPVANFPTKMGAKKAELARFPPKDPAKLARLRKQVDKLLKDPKKRAESEKSAQKQKGTDSSTPAPKKESREMVEAAIVSREIIGSLLGKRPKGLNESLFKEAAPGSDWDQYISKMPEKVLSADKRFQTVSKNITKKTEKVLNDAFAAIRKAVPKTVKMKSYGVKNDARTRKTYLAFSAMIDKTEVGPIAIYTENGVPKIELSDEAKMALQKADPKSAKTFRAELITVQERILDNEEELVKAIQARDKYLGKLEEEVDGFVANLAPLQLSLLKQLLVKKYRKV